MSEEGWEEGGLQAFGEYMSLVQGIANVKLSYYFCPFGLLNELEIHIHFKQTTFQLKKIVSSPNTTHQSTGFGFPRDIEADKACTLSPVLPL